ncbi:MAG: Mpo1-like protein [Usitatibacter sp.]
MAPIEQNLTQYAAYHRDRRNIVTHFVGVPLIVFSIILTLATVAIPAGSIAITLAAVVSVCASIYYLKLDIALGITMAIVLFAMCAGASEMTARMSTAAALGAALALFVIGWAIQFLGHRFEGVKPAFYDDLKQLLIGPIFVCAEAYFLLGGRKDLRRYIEERDGRTLPILDEPRF